MPKGGNGSICIGARNYIANSNLESSDYIFTFDSYRGFLVNHRISKDALLLCRTVVGNSLVDLKR